MIGTDVSRGFDASRGTAFDDPDVADCYRFRTEYPAALIDAMVALSPGREAALDLGCGPGKLAGPLARHFGRVDAVDPSGPMLDAGARTHPEARIHWHRATAETVPLTRNYDLVCAGTSIHWMDHARLMPRLLAHLPEPGWLMVVDGDGAWDPPWQAEWDSFLDRWLRRVDRTYDPAGFADAMQSYRHWLDIAGERAFIAPCEQRVADFVACQHSRASWTHRVLGAQLSAQFDAQLQAVLDPFATNGVLTFDVRSTLTWGRPRLAADQSD